MSLPVRRSCQPGPFRRQGRAFRGGLADAVHRASPPARAQDGQRGPSLIRDTEIEEILHHDADPILASRRPRPQGRPDPPDRRQGPERLRRPPADDGRQHRPDPEDQEPQRAEGRHGPRNRPPGRRPPFRSGEMSSAGMRAHAADHGPGRPGRAAGAPRRRRGPARQRQLSSATLGALGYSREQEAPRRPGRRRLPREGRPLGQGPRRFLRQLPLPGGLRRSPALPVLPDHPLSSERIELLRSRVEAQPHYKAEDTPEAIAEHAIMKAKLDGFIDAAAGADRVHGDRHALPGPLRPGDRLLPDEGPGPGAEADRRPDRGAAGQPLPLRAEGPGPVRVRPRQGGRGAAAQVGGAEARRPAAAHQPRPDADRLDDRQEARRGHRRAEEGD